MVGLIGYVYVPFYKKMPSHFLKWLYSYTPRSSVRKFWMDTHTHKIFHFTSPTISTTRAMASMWGEGEQGRLRALILLQ